MDRLNILSVNARVEIVIKEIIRVQAISNYSSIHLSSGKKIVVAKVLHWFEETLPIDMFTRVHRSHLINKLFVKQIRGMRNKTLLLNNGECIAVSRRKRMLVNESSKFRHCRL